MLQHDPGISAPGADLRAAAAVPALPRWAGMAPRPVPALLAEPAGKPPGLPALRAANAQTAGVRHLSTPAAAVRPGHCPGTLPGAS